MVWSSAPRSEGDTFAGPGPGALTEEGRGVDRALRHDRHELVDGHGLCAPQLLQPLARRAERLQERLLRAGRSQQATQDGAQICEQRSLTHRRDLAGEVLHRRVVSGLRAL
jgi:hypothetical protein